MALLEHNAVNAVMDYIGPLADVVTQEREEKERRVQDPINIVGQVHTNTPKEVSGYFLVEVLRSTALFLLGMCALIGLDRANHFLVGQFPPTSLHSWVFAGGAILKLAIGLNLALFVMNLIRSFVRVLYRAA
jgi:hypothetical protein